MATARTPDVIRAQRETIAAQINVLRVKQRALSDELREAEGPIPDRDGRPAKDAGYTIKPV